MTDSTTDRTETRILSADETGEMQGRHRSLTGADIYKLRASHEALRAQLAVAYDVIRRLRDGLKPGDTHWWQPYGAGLNHVMQRDAVTPIQRAVLDAVAGPNDTEENRDA